MFIREEGPSRVKKIAALAIVAVHLAVVLTACNTTEGFGQDVENLGDAIEDSARDAKD